MHTNDWTAHYENITGMIVPRSSILITSDAEYSLFNVTLFKKVNSQRTTKQKYFQFYDI